SAAATRNPRRSRPVLPFGLPAPALHSAGVTRASGRNVSSRCWKRSFQPARLVVTKRPTAITCLDDRWRCGAVAGLTAHVRLLLQSNGSNETPRRRLVANRHCICRECPPPPPPPERKRLIAPLALQSRRAFDEKPEDHCPIIVGQFD